jgi:hypothetical protein
MNTVIKSCDFIESHIQTNLWIWADTATRTNKYANMPYKKNTHLIKLSYKN